VPALEALVAAAAAADMDVELAVDGAARDLDLILVGDVGLLDGPAASGAGFGQGRFVGFVDVRGGLAMGLGAVVRAGLAAGLFGLGLGRALGEGRGLALAGALGLFQLAGQAFDLSFELCEAALEVGDALVALPAALTDRGIHTLIVAREARRRGGRSAPRGTEALNKYHPGLRQVGRISLPQARSGQVG
jgi:hypothetical protein